MKLYLGVDLHKRSCWMTVMDVEGGFWNRSAWGRSEKAVPSRRGRKDC